MSVSQALPTQTPRLLKTRCAAARLACQSAACRERCGRSGCSGGGLVLSLKCLHGGRGQPHQALDRRGWLCPGGRNGFHPPHWSGTPASSLAAAWPLSSMPIAQGGTQHLLLLWRGVCVKSDSCNQGLLTEHSKPCRGQAGCACTDMSPPPWGHCQRALSWHSKETQSSQAASLHARAAPGECKRPPVLGGDTWCDPRDPLCQTSCVQLTVGQDTHTPMHWDGSWGKQVEKSRQFAHQCWLEVTTASAPITAASRPLRHQQPPQNGLPKAELQLLPSEPRHSALP